jgi:hypothetical protein
MASTIAFGNDNHGLQAGTINGPVQASFHYGTGTSRKESFAGSEQALTAAPLQHDQRHHLNHRS